MKLSLIERKILWNQLEILKGREDADVDGLNKWQTILADGYQPLYSRLFEHMDKDELTESETKFVYDVLTMFEGLQRFEEAGHKITGIMPRFVGFDGNNETKLMGFVRFLVEQDERWTYLNIRDFNSHYPVVDTYGRMISEWRKIPESTRYMPLTPEQVDAIQAAAVHPSNR